MGITEKLRELIPNGYGYNSEFARTMEEAAVEIERLKCGIFSAKEQAAEWRMKAKTSELRAQYLEARCVQMDAAIRRALADSESGSGWGPDVTVCGYLRDALRHNVTGLAPGKGDK